MAEGDGHPVLRESEDGAPEAAGVPDLNQSPESGHLDGRVPLPRHAVPSRARNLKRAGGLATMCPDPWCVTKPLRVTYYKLFRFLQFHRKNLY